MVGNLTVFLGPAASITYVLFASLAYLSYPGTFGPFNNNWLSDLGNRIANPNGADAYAAGCTLTGLMVIGFFGGLLAWRAGATRIQKYLLAFTQLAGLVAGIAVMMSAVYSIDQFAAHQFWTRLTSAGLAMALFVTPFALHRSNMKLWPVVAITALGYLSIVARLIFPDAHWLEWPSIAFLLVYLWVVAIMTRAVVAGESRLPAARPTLVKPA